MAAKLSNSCHTISRYWQEFCTPTFPKVTSWSSITLARRLSSGILDNRWTYTSQDLPKAYSIPSSAWDSTRSSAWRKQSYRKKMHLQSLRSVSIPTLMASTMKLVTLEMECSPSKCTLARLQINLLIRGVLPAKILWPCSTKWCTSSCFKRRCILTLKISNLASARRAKAVLITSCEQAISSPAYSLRKRSRR